MPEDQELGGYVYERAYFQFRHPPPETLTGEALDNFMELELEPMEEALEMLFQPSHSERLCYEFAIEAFIHQQRHGDFMFPGAYLEQPAMYLYALDCIMTADERARKEERALQAQMQANERKNAEQQAQGNTGAYGTSDLG